jgi:trk system potassium uptake protein TrkH
MWQPVFMISGYILGLLGLIMLIPAGVDMSSTDMSWSPFLTASTVSVFFGFSLFLSNYTKVEKITLKQAYLVTTISWLMLVLFSALPFILYDVTDVTDALFEATSGVTGTGATIMTDVEILPRSILLWRSILNYVGGLGVVIFAVALLPFLGIGGMQMFQRENSDSNDKFMPKFSYIAKRIMLVYFLLLMVCACMLFLCGMGWFDAINHAMSAIGTGGFSTKNDSIAYFNSALLETVLMFFMLAGALPMTFYIMLFRGVAPDKNRQVAVFLKTVFVIGIAVGICLYAGSEYSLVQSLHHSFFNVISIITTTGLTSGNFIAWGVWTTAVFMMLSFGGGCTGSTSGSVKVFRWQTIYAFLRKYMLSAIEPNRVVPLKIGEISASEKVTMSVFVYLFLFIICVMFLAVVVSLCGVDFNTSLAAVVACMTNVGVGSVEIIGPHGNFAFFSDIVKYILCFAMFLGRLEVVTVLAIFSKSFWRN